MEEINVLAVDLGGSSGRVVLGTLTDKTITLKEVHRFKEYMYRDEKHMRWDINKIFNEILKGIKHSCQLAPKLKSLGIDTWGVDFGLIDVNQVYATPICYRDHYTSEIFHKVVKKLGEDYLFEHTGMQALAINSLFQLVAQDEEKTIDTSDTLLLIPDLLNFLLTGEKKTEETIASTTQLLNPYTNFWNRDLIDVLELPQSIFCNLVSAGNILGTIKSSISKENSVNKIQVVNVAAHDTASAVYSIPQLDGNLFLSSGTWSLLGLEVDAPIITKETQQANFSNEKSAVGKTLLLKNLTGLWLIEEILREYKKSGWLYNYDQLSKLTIAHEKSKEPICYIDTDDPIFTSPGDSVKKIQLFAEKTEQPVPTSVGAIANSIYKSLAFKYRTTFEQLKVITNRSMEDKKLIIVGGGSQSAILCQYTANSLNKLVQAGLAEATALGNCLMQFEAIADIPRSKLEKLVSQTFVYENYEPEDVELWNEEYSKYKKIMEDRQNELSKNWYPSND